MKKYLFIAMITLPLIALASWAGWLAWERSGGQEVKVTIAGYDPRDLLSGHYIAYSIDWDRTDCKQFNAQGICPKEEFCKQARWGRQCRFYIPDVKAARLDEVFRHRGEEMRFEAVYSYSPGRTPFAKQLLINGQDWETFLGNEKSIR